MVPNWKLQREAERLKRQFQGLWWRATGSLRTWLYDRRRREVVRVSEGDQPLRDELAVLLIYQPDGLLASTVHTLSWFVSEGVSPVVVSNCPLTEADMQRLRAVSYLVIERPNIGYDFGGYREGVLKILERGIRPAALYVLNDSMWFPLRDDCDVIRQSRASPADIFGLYTGWLGRRSGGQEYIQSYFFRFSARLVSGDAFQHYWKRLKLMDQKHVVIRSFERNLAGHFARIGYTSGSVIRWQEIVDYVLKLDDEDTLRDILVFQCRTSRKDREIIQPLLDDGLGPFEIRDRIRDLIEKRVVFVKMASLHPAIIEGVRIPFLKKLGGDDMGAQRDVIRSLGLHRDYHPSVRAEIDRWDSPEQRIERIADPKERRDA